jgi:hypothetical protein
MSLKLYLLMNLLGFYTGYFLTSMIKTEMVALDPPAVYTSYQELIDHDVIPKWLEDAGEHSTFQFAAEGSPERKIWDRVAERGINQSIISLQAALNSDPSVLLAHIHQAAERKAVLMHRFLLARLFVSNMCAFARQNGLVPRSNAFITSDPTAREEVIMMLGSVHADQRFQRVMRSSLCRKVERGLFVKTFDPFIFLVASNEGHVAEVEECMASVIVAPEHNSQAVPLHHYRDLAILVTLMLIACIIRMLYECLKRQRVRNKIGCIRSLRTRAADGNNFFEEIILTDIHEQDETPPVPFNSPPNT